MDPKRRRFWLREQTSDAHHALDQAIGPLDARDAYLNYLRRIYAARAGVEAALDAAPRTGHTPEPLAALLTLDLADLGCEPPAVRAFSGQALSGSAALGVAYVLEGSALGARFLQPQAHALGFTPDFGARHLGAQTASPGWKAFLRALETAPTFDADEAAGAATAVFRHFMDAGR